MNNANDELMKTLKDTYKTDVDVLKYLDQMDDKVRIALSIAKDHLGSSFHLTKSNGYVCYKKK